ncbi:Hypothetical protein PHPALM_37954 [Phytophthora palmivora]|uniref:Jacalin-type lectin domain-containing protein n=1 Tax=Phytophthora palmivora TaxID=4796 RepID=A0A2P4WW48_9STRA|nr:Hypothetical protein PHPALM_37954 [Phytophthora palmivora]
MKFFYQVLATVALAASVVTALEKGIMLGQTFGGPHGDKAITVRSADRVDGVALDIVDLAGQPSTLEHGGGGGDKITLTLGADEHITGIEVHWGKYYRKTRIMFIQFTTDKGNIIKGGTPQDNTDKIAKENADEGYQLGGFMGFAGHELDSIGAIWTSIQPVA